MKKLLIALSWLLISASAVAQTDQAKSVSTTQTFGDYTVHFSVFNSTFITPEVAKIYQLTRAGNRSLVNISVTKTADGKTSLGLPANIKGTATNLIQQQSSLNFKTISEGDATYYIASLRHTHEELINFVVEIQPEGVAQPMTVRFARTLYVEK